MKIPWDKFGKTENLIPRCNLFDLRNYPLVYIHHLRESIMGIEEESKEKYLGVRGKCKSCIYKVACFDLSRVSRSSDEVGRIAARMRRAARKLDSDESLNLRSR